VTDYGFPFQGDEPVPAVPSDPWKGLGREPGEGSHGIRFPGGNPNVPTIRFLGVLKRGKGLPRLLAAIRHGGEENVRRADKDSRLGASVEEVEPRVGREVPPEFEG
jgi:hypothetical protein